MQVVLKVVLVLRVLLLLLLPVVLLRRTAVAAAAAAAAPSATCCSCTVAGRGRARVSGRRRRWQGPAAARAAAAASAARMEEPVYTLIEACLRNVNEAKRAVRELRRARPGAGSGAREAASAPSRSEPADEDADDGAAAERDEASDSPRHKLGLLAQQRLRIEQEREQLVRAREEERGDGDDDDVDDGERRQLARHSRRQQQGVRGEDMVSPQQSPKRSPKRSPRLSPKPAVAVTAAASREPSGSRLPLRRRSNQLLEGLRNTPGPADAGADESQQGSSNERAVVEETLRDFSNKLARWRASGSPEPAQFAAYLSDHFLCAKLDPLPKTKMVAIARKAVVMEIEKISRQAGAGPGASEADVGAAAPAAAGASALQLRPRDQLRQSMVRSGHRRLASAAQGEMVSEPPEQQPAPAAGEADATQAQAYLKNLRRQLPQPPQARQPAAQPAAAQSALQSPAQLAAAPRRTNFNDLMERLEKQHSQLHSQLHANRT